MKAQISNFYHNRRTDIVVDLKPVTIEPLGSSESIYENENVENGDFGLVEESFDENLEKSDALVHESSENLSAHPNLVENGLTKPEIEPITKVELVSLVGVKMAEFCGFGTVQLESRSFMLYIAIVYTCWPIVDFTINNRGWSLNYVEGHRSDFKGRGARHPANI